MPKVLYICHANVARSQWAEAYHELYAGLDTAISGGMIHEIQEIYKRIPPGIANLVKEEGIDISNKRPKVVTFDMASSVDRIVVLCQREICFSFLHTDKTEYWDIEDPVATKTKDEQREIRDLIKERVKTLLNS